MSDTPVTLEFLARQQARLLEEMVALRDDIEVLTVITRRVDGSLALLVDGSLPSLVVEMRAVHSRFEQLAKVWLS